MDKKNIPCSNCGKYNHVYKKCDDPITSLGIIAFKIEGDRSRFLPFFKKYDIMRQNVKVSLNNLDDRIKFLLVRRKNTLGFTEFVRGRYSLEHNNTIKFLFQQMTQEEINNISTKTFNSLWFEMWASDRKTYKNEFEISKTKYNALLNRKEYNLAYFCRNIIPKWNMAEWGFPKGRRNMKEDNKTCAVREFIEETNYDYGDFMILNDIKPITEVYHGTNGIQYKHIYFLAKMISRKDAKINDENKHQYHEIGDTGWFNYKQTLNLIRPYHTERIVILEKVYSFLSKYFKKNENNFFKDLIVD